MWKSQVYGHHDKMARTKTQLSLCFLYHLTSITGQGLERHKLHAVDLLTIPLNYINGDTINTKEMPKNKPQLIKLTRRLSKLVNHFNYLKKM